MTLFDMLFKCNEYFQEFIIYIDEDVDIQSPLAKGIVNEINKKIDISEQKEYLVSGYTVGTAAIIIYVYKSVGV